MTDPTHFQDMLDTLAPVSVTWRVGSHLHGTAGPDSDEDFVTVYHHHDDDRRVFRQYPDVLHTPDDDHKLYSLRKFAEMLEKGNPNAVELVTATPLRAPDACEYGGVTEFLRMVAPTVRHRGFYGACLGHASGVLQHGRNNKGVTLSGEIVFEAAERKRVAHAIRVAALGLELRRGPINTTVLRGVKYGPTPRQEAYDILQTLVEELEHVYGNAMMFTSTPLKEAINHFFLLD